MSPVLVLTTMVYDSALGFLITAVGGAVLVLVTELFGRSLGDARYLSCARIYSRASVVLLTAACALLVAAVWAAGSLNPTPALLLPYLRSVWLVPLSATLAPLLVSACLMLLYGRALEGPRDHPIPPGRVPSLLAASAAAAACLSLIFFSLLNSYVLTPSIPSSLPVVVQAGSLAPLTQLELMANASWLPLSVKLFLVGCAAFSASFSGAAAIRRIERGRSDEQRRWLDFVVSWSFKTALVFGASLGVVGYWCASVLHTEDPTLAGGLMGVAMNGVSAALVLSMRVLWDVGTGGAMSLGAMAGVYYLSRGRGTVTFGSSEQKVLRMFVPVLLALLCIGTYGVLLAGEDYPRQFVLAIAVILAGYLVLEAVRRYALGRARLYVPALIFMGCCYGLLLYQAPNTLWYDAVAYGGISWPLLGFPLLAVTTYYFATRWREMKYLIPVAVATMVLLIVTVKVADVALVRGPTIVALDPATTNAVLEWALKTDNGLTFLYQQYPMPGDSELLVALSLSYALFLGMFYWFQRIILPADGPVGGEEPRQAGS